MVAAGAGPEVSVGQVELLDAERTALVLVVVDELVLLYPGHDGEPGGVSPSEVAERRAAAVRGRRASEQARKESKHKQTPAGRESERDALVVMGAQRLHLRHGPARIRRRATYISAPPVRP